jgi:sec-independent protein translocase protein TatA
MFGMGHWEILIIFVVILLIFGAKRIPEMAQGMGKGIKEFRKAMRDVQEEIDITDTAHTAAPNKSIETSTPPQSVAQNTPAQSEEKAEVSPKQST